MTKGVCVYKPPQQKSKIMLPQINTLYYYKYFSIYLYNINLLYLYLSYLLYSSYNNFCFNLLHVLIPLAEGCTHTRGGA